MLSGVYRLNATELMLPYRVESLPPPGGRLSVRVVEKLEQRRASVGHLPKDEVARDAHLRPAKEQTSNTVLLPNPSRVKSTDTAPPPLPQTQEYDGLRATLRGVAVKPLGGGEFTVEPQVELRWNGGELANAFRHYWSISTPGGPRTEPGFRLSVFIDSMPEYPPQPHMLPTAPMRGHQAWTLHLNVVSTAAFPELVNERGLPLFSTPVAARRQKGAPPPPEFTTGEIDGHRCRASGDRDGDDQRLFFDHAPNKPDLTGNAHFFEHWSERINERTAG